VRGAAAENEWLQRRLKTMKTLAFGGPTIRPPAKGEEAGHDQRIAHAQHRARITSMQPATDTASPRVYKHLSENLKGKQKFADQMEEIRRNNQISLQRLAAMQPMSRRRSQRSKRRHKLGEEGAETERGVMAETSKSSASTFGSARTGSSKKSASARDYNSYIMEMDHQMHRTRVEKQTPVVVTDTPPKYPHLSANLKGRQIAKEKREEVVRYD
jgi:hypothetical protein